MPTEFTPFQALLGGTLIGISAAAMMFVNGRIAGISGIIGGLLQAPSGDRAWRLAFLAGLLTAPLVYGFVGGDVRVDLSVSTWMLVAAGALVGVGTQLGGGCTSGHGVCGIARLSARSIAATSTFMITAGVTVFIIRHSGV